MSNTIKEEKQQQNTTEKSSNESFAFFDYDLVGTHF